MDINEKKWHYKLYCFVHDPFSVFDRDTPKKKVPKSLCGYFWATVSLTITLILLAPVILLVTAAVWVVFVINDTLAERRIRRGRPKNEKEKDKWKDTKPKEPNMLFEYLKARKQKYCPRITVVNNAGQWYDEDWKEWRAKS